ncbi:MAG: hypothetical protein JNK15_22560 [Planctomycetes bacterium]|nr:hypothetical protein [Planctomycetota bacterium]
MPTPARFGDVSDPRPLAMDTSADAEARQFAIWASMTPAEKFAAFEDLHRLAIALAEAGIRMRHPQASDREVFLRRVARSDNRRTMSAAYGWAPEAGE